MSKITTVIIFFSLIVAVAAVDFKFNHYDDYARNVRKNIAANVIYSNEEKPVAVSDVKSLPATFSSDAADSKIQSSQPDVSVGMDQPFITTEQLAKAGLDTIILKPENFSGVLFEMIDLRDFKTIPVIEQTGQAQDQLITFYEFHAHDAMLSQEIYSFIEEKAQGSIDYAINATNAYGEASFFVNDPQKPGFVFLVVKIRESVYAVSYQKELHDSLKNLFFLLH